MTTYWASTNSDLGCGVWGRNDHRLVCQQKPKSIARDIDAFGTQPGFHHFDKLWKRS